MVVRSVHNTHCRPISLYLPPELFGIYITRFMTIVNTIYAHDIKSGHHFLCRQIELVTGGRAEIVMVVYSI